ncbi:MAG: hypothetical protein L0154_13320 [Chloroflexi bacterium]|nr:hypothetical protein [Chloroflexota bacterium]
MQSKTLVSVATPQITESDAQQIAAAYVLKNIAESFEVVAGAYYYSKPHDRKLWRFFIRNEHGSVGMIMVDPQTAEVMPLTDDEIDIVHEKAAILNARKRGVPAFGEDGYVLCEYARRQANHYLTMNVGLQATPTDAVFVPLERPVWQFLIEVCLPRTGTIGVFGIIDVDARSGEVISLTDEQIQQIWSRGNAAAEFFSQKAAV